MPRHVLTLDFETYYDDQYSLRRMTPAEYILNPRFETILVACKADDGPHEVVDAPDFPKWLAQYPAEDTTTITFNALFDNAILAWRYGYVPSTMLDAMAMARALLGHKLVRFNLAALSEHFGLDAKADAIHKVKGLNRAAIMSVPALWKEFGEYALRDNMNCESIFAKLYALMPWSERRLMDMVLRCCVEPRFMVDTALLRQHIEDVRQEKENLLIAAGNVDKTLVMSSVKFQAALEALGVDIEFKTTAAGNEVPAFAKSDEFMERLLNDADPDVVALAAARIGIKSTLEETRAGTLLRIGELDWTDVALVSKAQYALAERFDPYFPCVDVPPYGSMPIPLRYGGAHTHRLSGDWKMNMQNMPTVRGSKGKSKLRLSLKAPPGHTVVTCDLGQIEARLVAWICGATALIEEFAKKLDPYNKLAGAIFGRPVNRKLVGTVDEIMGFIGKTGILGLGYGCGKPNFHNMVIRSARTQGVDISAIYNEAVGFKGVDAYRTRYHQIPTAWGKLQRIVSMQWSDPYVGATPVRFGPGAGCVEISFGKIMLPSGLPMEYGDPKKIQTFKQGVTRDEYVYRYGKFTHRMYGPKMLENIVQALARIIVMNAALRIRDHGKTRPCPWAYRFVHQAHDELVFIVPDSELDIAKKLIHTEMTRPPSWALDLPLTADIGTGASYGEAK
jgi:DNA polymerase